MAAASPLEKAGPTGRDCDYVILMPHPTSCSMFLTCSNNMEYEMDCPQSLWFGFDQQYCDYPENVDCQVLSTTTTEPTTTDVTEETTTEVTEETTTTDITEETTTDTTEETTTTDTTEETTTDVTEETTTTNA